MKEAPTNQSSPVASSTRPAVVFSTSQGARDYQEDACGHWFDGEGDRLFAVVADGAGGHGGGAEAAQAAIGSASEAWKAGLQGEDAAGFLDVWMAQAHRSVNEASAKINKSARAVVVACLIDGDAAHWVHAGDCRLLRFREGKFVERTRDDSVVQVLLERGEITEEEMGRHPDQSRLLQSLGGDDPPTPRPGRADLEAGDVLMLCSDGFWEHLKPDELEKLASAPPARRQGALDAAVVEAVKRGGEKADNTTAVMIHFGDDAASSSCICRWHLWLLLAALAGGVAAWWVIRTDSGHSWLKHLQQIRSRVISEKESTPAKESLPPVVSPRFESSPQSEEQAPVPEL